MAKPFSAVGLIIALGCFSWFGQPQAQEMQREAAAAPLAERLRDADQRVRRSAARDARALGPTAVDALPALIGAYDVSGGADITTRSLVIETVEAIGPRASAAVPMLIHALRDDPTSTVRRRAARALGAVGVVTPEVIDVLANAAAEEANAANRREAIEALAALVPAAGNELPLFLPVFARHLLEDRIYYVRSAAADALGDMGPATLELGAAPVLLQALGDGMPAVRNAAVDALARLGPGASTLLPELERIEIEHARSATARAAARAIELITARSAASAATLGVLIGQLQDPEVEIRRAAAEELRVRAPVSTSVLPALVEAMTDDPDQRVRLTAIGTMADVGELAVIARPALERLAQADPDRVIREASTGALSAMDTSPEPRLKAAVAPAPAPFDPPTALAPAAPADVDPNDYTFSQTLARVFRHERCMNCHTFRRPGGMWERTHVARIGAFDPNSIPNFRSCASCHTEALTDVSFWFHPISVIDEDWDERTNEEICQTVTQRFGVGRMDYEQAAAAARHHFFEDALLQWALFSRRTPDGIVQPGPIGSSEEWQQLVNAWIDLGGMRCRPMTLADLVQLPDTEPDLGSAGSGAAVSLEERLAEAPAPLITAEEDEKADGGLLPAPPGPREVERGATTIDERRAETSAGVLSDSDTDTADSDWSPVVVIAPTLEMTGTRPRRGVLGDSPR